MHHHYRDIRSRIAEEPKWFDENAVPRYDRFTPDQTADIYADECVLLEIACQSCGKHTLVCLSESWSHRIVQLMFRAEYVNLPTEAEKKAWWEQQTKTPLADSIREGGLGYGDPPNDHDCAGVTMTSDDVRVCEYWCKVNGKWTRDRSLEVALFDSIYKEGDDDATTTPEV